MLTSVSSILYTYDFTKLNSEKEFGQNWWVRVPTAKYLPSLEHENPSLLAYLASHKFADNVCPSHKDKCEMLSDKGSKLRYLCEGINIVRKK
jgi:hypothetical protein